MLKDKLAQAFDAFDRELEIDDARQVMAALAAEPEAEVEPEADPAEARHGALLQAIEAMNAGVALLIEAVTAQTAKFDLLIAGQKAVLKAAKAKKKLIFDDDGRPVAAEIDA